MKHVHDEGIISEEMNKQATYPWWKEPTPLGAANASLRLFAKLMELGRNAWANRCGNIGKHQ